jgi:hypothetical protein
MFNITKEQARFLLAAAYTGKESGRERIKGVHLIVTDDFITLESTDGHRYHGLRIRNIDTPTCEGFISIDCMKEIIKSGKSPEIRLSKVEDGLLLTVGDKKVSWDISCGEGYFYPDCSKVLPRFGDLSLKTVASVSAKYVYDAVKAFNNNGHFQVLGEWNRPSLILSSDFTGTQAKSFIEGGPGIVCVVMSNRDDFS